MTCRKAAAKKADEPSCSFCGRSHKEVTHLIGGPGVNICDACVMLCSEIVAEHRTKKLPKKPKKSKDV